MASIHNLGCGRWRADQLRGGSCLQLWRCNAQLNVSKCSGIRTPSGCNVTRGHSSHASRRMPHPPAASKIAQTGVGQDSSKPSSIDVQGVLLLGFTGEEQAGMFENATSLFGDMPPSALLNVSSSMARSMTVSQLVQHLAGRQEQQQQQGDQEFAQPSEEGGVCEARVIYLIGQSSQAIAPGLNDALVEAGVAPAVIGMLTPKHADLTMEAAAHMLRRAHARYWDLVRPLSLGPHAPAVAAASASSSGQQAVAGGSNEKQDVLAQLREARVVVSATMDAGEVPSPFGGWRRDEAQAVVLDGLVSSEERAALLDWLTEPGHDHGGPPPASRWELSCVDREGDNPTWGLKPEVLKRLEEEPPAPMLALQARLAALYPEYQLAHMPADVLAEDEGMGMGAAGLSAFVGNAVMNGDPCAWHDDADPASFPPSSPWVHCYGYYYNRQPRRPRFVTLLLYLNEAWGEELQAETLFADPSADAGIFVRPIPGRVVLMDQDTSHRIAAPSKAANGAPRYSLVWKLVWFDHDDPTLPSGVEGGSRSAGAAASKQQPGLCRPEWGPPMRFGSAGEHLGRPAWQQ
uniref:Fe2OG dioxygenase domain-containing protein n=1 Tax=Chlamydomonas leiostraca TaxID=1034604 RepID=A0A7S0WFF4_9CHLO